MCCYVLRDQHIEQKFDLQIMTFICSFDNEGQLIELYNNQIITQISKPWPNYFSEM